MFQNVVIVGPGLIGGSLGLAMKENGLAERIVGVGHRTSSLDRARAMGAIDEGTLDLVAAVGEADLVVLAASVQLICEHASTAVGRMKDGAILTDVGSVKQAICDGVRDALDARSEGTVRFVGAHPLAGSEQRGIQAARGDLYQDALCVLTPTGETDGDARTRVRQLWEAVGCRVVEYAPEVHDRMLAQISHLPHVVAACLVNTASDDAIELAAGGFMDTTRVASGDAALWRDICLLNRKALAESLRDFGEVFHRFAQAVENGDAKAVEDELARAKTRRDDRMPSKG